MDVSFISSVPLHRFRKLIHQYQLDIGVALALALLAGVLCYVGQQSLNPVLSESHNAGSVWFEADISRVYANLTDRGSDHYRTKVHPLFSLFGYLPTFALAKLLSTDRMTAVQIFVGAIAALWMTALYTLLRMLGCLRLDAVVFSLLAVPSAAALFFFSVPETYSMGSLSILLGLGLALWAESATVLPVWYVIIGIATISITITNWMVGLVAAWVEFPRRLFLQIATNTFCLTTLLWAVQKYIFPTAGFFLGDDEERAYVLNPESGGPLVVLRSLITHTLVMPQFYLVREDRDWPLMLTQMALPGSASLWGAIAVGLWVGLLGLGIWGFTRLNTHPKFRLVFGLSLLGQVLLHLVYGEETFLYALHFLPFLIILAAMSSLTRARGVALGLTTVLIVLAGVNNLQVWNQARAHLDNHGTPRQLVQGQIRQRPADPWPRGEGHVVMALPGTLEEDKAYYEPGGSFSPAVGSFGVSIWLLDAAGQIVATSDSIPLDQMTQRLEYGSGQPIPELVTETEFYTARWRSTGLGQWRLTLTTAPDNPHHLAVALRSVGPAGGAIAQLRKADETVRINDRWLVQPSAGTATTTLGSETDANWITAQSDVSEWTDDQGWGYARLDLADADTWSLAIKDLTLPQSPQLTATQVQSTVSVDLPDTRFADSLNAQVAHMMMGLVGQQTRPGEPTNYPLAWQRDGTYELVALAQAGQLEVAKALAVDFAERDFFGGFGAEADAPGLAIWALETVAEQVADPAYDQWLWPHIQRKAVLIETMLTTNDWIYQTFEGPMVPAMRDKLYEEAAKIAGPTRDGLIIGMMDHQYPLLFINAVSYRGLMDAATLAERVNQPTEAERWRSRAQSIQAAWTRELQKQPSGLKESLKQLLSQWFGLTFREAMESANERTYISGLWPSWVATQAIDTYEQNLGDRWSTLRDDQGAFRNTPLWTYFDVAEAHQWLYLGQADRVWATVEWFWQHQVSPGLYTWWEGDGEENASGRWERVRGWLDPAHVTPHYWTASEMVLLQLDMLAYGDRTTDTPTLVIGAGIPADWVSQPMRVDGLHVLGRQVDWAWDGQQMQVQVTGEPLPVKLGTAFGAETPLLVSTNDTSTT
ncbi:MAG: hypothetical protein KME20_13105 [Kaiparowitsia implicata GSE-PSE-MK54-09C]|jgi:hypothetical protein|nr:hypothetical protein [Kaiparowitsia implicata GSE-PSE-MK54-09C]